MLISPNGAVTGVLISGGLDSCILVATMIQEGSSVRPFYVRSGVVWEAEELAATQRFLQAIDHPRLNPLVILNLPLGDVYTSHWSMTGEGTPAADTPDEAVYLPGRNALLLIKAAVWCQLYGVHRLALAPLGTSPFADASLEFVQKFQRAVNCGAPAELEIVLPFAGMDKRQVMELGRRFPLEHSFSCIAPMSGLHCGRCNKCGERRQAFRLVGIADPTRYASGGVAAP
jgi:7-cyano-7-deazaguanine synthase